jgi:putative Holliday junction resolvase
LNHSESPNTLLAFDYGLSQIGVAVGNTLSNTSQPLTVLSARDGVPQWSEVEALLRDWEPDLIVVGLPLNMNGSESEMSVRAKKFARRLEGRFAVTTTMVDERLSSFEAKSLLEKQGHRGNYKEVPADALAAQLILNSWFEYRGTPV